MDTAVLETMSLARGLAIGRMNPADDLLLPPGSPTGTLGKYRALLDHYAVRLLLKEAVKSETPDQWRRGRRSVERFCRPEALDQYLNQLEKMGVVTGTDQGRPALCKKVTSFGATYEWYVARLLMEEFSCPSAWGVLFSGMESGGDHDVIASLSGDFLYMEVKTAPPKHIEQPEVTGFMRRLWDIAPDIAVFHDDTHLRMKDKVVPLMEEAVALVRAKRHSGIQAGENGSGSSAGGRARPVRFERLEREIFHLDGRIYIVNSKPDLRRNLAVVFRHYFRSRNPLINSLGPMGA